MKLFGHSGHHSASAHSASAQSATAAKPGKSHAKQVLAAVAAGAVIIAGGVFASNSIYQGKAVATKSDSSQMRSYSATDLSDVSDYQAASRGEARGSRGAGADTVSVKVVINGETQYVLGTDFTDVKSVLATGNISLDPTDTVKPALTDKVTESTVITITRPNAAIETTTQDIPFNTVEQKTDSLPAGTTQVKSEGKNGTMEFTNLVQKSGGAVISSNTLTAYVKTAPEDRVILIGTGAVSSDSDSSSSSSSSSSNSGSSSSDSSSSSSSNSNSGSSSSSNSGSSSGSSSLGTTVPAGEMQEWSHKYLLDNGYNEDDFTALVYIITHESGWNPQATNPSSGAYGLPQSLPGSKMASAGADWQTNYQTQIKWFLSYCNERYGGVTQAYNYWLANHSY